MKTKMNRLFLRARAVLAAFVLCAVQTGYAQNLDCGVPYAAIDRENLRPYVAESLMIAAFLPRLTALATLSQFGNFSATQRMALNSEYQALLTNITVGGNWHVPNFRPRTNAWLHRVIDSDFLTLTGTDILTEHSANIAQWATYEAARRLYICS